MHTRTVTSVAAPTSLFDLLGLDIRHVKGVQLELATGSVNFGDQAVQAKALSATPTEIMPIDNLKVHFLSGVGTANVCVFT